MCNIHQHQVLTDIMVRKGSGFVGRHGDDFLTTNDPAWVGFSVEIGPEGGVYILDWHEEDVDDHNIPRMLWFALEPMVPQHPGKALDLAVQARIPILQEHVARRMLSGGTAATANPSAKRDEWTRILQRIAPGFEPRNVGQGGVVALSSFRNEPVVQTHPKDRNTACALARRLDVPTGKTTTLRIRATYHPHGDWQLRVLANMNVLADQLVSFATVQDEWLELNIDLTRFAGTSVDLTVENRSNDWKNEFGYWSRITVVSK